MNFLSGKNGVEILPYCARSNVHFLFFKTFYDRFCSAKAKAVDGKAKNIV